MVCVSGDIGHTQVAWDRTTKRVSEWAAFNSRVERLFTLLRFCRHAWQARLGRPILGIVEYVDWTDRAPLARFAAISTLFPARAKTHNYWCRRPTLSWHRSIHGCRLSYVPLWLGLGLAWLSQILSDLTRNCVYRSGRLYIVLVWSYFRKWYLSCFQLEYQEYT